MTDRKKENLFAKLAAQQAKPDAVEVAAPSNQEMEPPPPSPAPVETPKPKPSSRRKAEPVRGKKSNPDYCQANGYIPKKLRRAVERELLDIDGMDYSTLLEELLTKWLKHRGVSA